MKQIKLEPIVHNALQTNKSTREDDHLLYVEVVYALRPDLVNSNFLDVFKQVKVLKLPTFESVSRVRRKLQEKYEDLRGSRIIQVARAEKEAEFVEYSRR